MHSDKSGRLLGDIFPWLLLLLSVVFVGAIIIYVARRYLRDDRASSAQGFTLHDLRQLHAAGELTDEQFERAKSMMIGRLSGPSKSTTVPSGEPSGGSSPGNHEESST